LHNATYLKNTLNKNTCCGDNKVNTVSNITNGMHECRGLKTVNVKGLSKAKHMIKNSFIKQKR
jgi:hypothetical protein